MAPFPCLKIFYVTFAIIRVSAVILKIQFNLLFKKKWKKLCPGLFFVINFWIYLSAFGSILDNLDSDFLGLG